ncbi:MAG TPA: putative aminohydrolase SsnA [Blastocatellia bacterium]|nr:putative aminohydrolase SsnA [Blastocatellia bacterium]
MSPHPPKSYLLKSATLLRLAPAAVERADLRIRDGRIVKRGTRLRASADDEVIDLSGKLLLPGMVCAHTHLYSALARGMPAPPRVPANFREILELVWWRLDRALDEETIYWSAVAGAMDAARAGTTCLFDHHASPSHIKGSLSIVQEAMAAIGLRGALCYEITDRGGARKRMAGINETRDFARWTNAPGQASTATRSDRQFRALVGAHASFTLSDEALAACAEMIRETGAGLHIHVAEDGYDVVHARANYGLGVVERLARFDALNDQTILAHGVHLSKRDIRIARHAGAWFAHNPRSNMNNQVGYAPVAEFGERVVMGTDGIGADMFDEARFAFFKGSDARLPRGAGDWLSVLANNQRLASQTFGVEMGTLDENAAADLVVMDYRRPTPLTAENLAGHFMFGMSSAMIESVMVAGRFIIRDRRAAYPEAALYERAQQAAAKLWKKLQRSRP